MLCVELPQMQYIDWSELIHVLKDLPIMTSEHLYLSTIFVVSHFWRTFDCYSLDWRLHQVFGTLKKCPFPLNRDVPSLEVTNTKIMWIYPGPNPGGGGHLGKFLLDMCRLPLRAPTPL